MPVCAVAAFFLALTAELHATDFTYRRVVDMALGSAILPTDVVETAKNACGTALCFAEALAQDLPDHVRLEPVTHPDTDSIRWATTTPSMISETTGDTLKLKLTHFGRKSVAEIREASAGAGGAGQRVELDLSGNEGGDFERMLAIAGLLIGPVPDAIEIDDGDDIERRSLQGPGARTWQVESVVIDEKTASAALLLARLLKAHASATVTGRPAHGEPVLLKHRIPIDHDWRLILPVAEIRVLQP